MASRYGITDLRARLRSWRDGEKNDPNQQDRSLSSDGQSRIKVNDESNDNDLSVLLESLIIPKLVSGKSDSNPLGFGQFCDDSLISDDSAMALNLPKKVPEPDGFSEKEVKDFANQILDVDASETLTLVEQKLSEGYNVDTIYLNLLAPAARYLGAEWENDNRDFVDVTMGLWRLQEILRELTLRNPPKIKASNGRRSALFSTMVGDQHSFGTLMISECFQRAGWCTDTLIDPSKSDLTHKVAGTYFDLVGLNVSSVCTVARLSQLIKGIRAVSNNPDIVILIGGFEVVQNPALVKECGADGTAKDAADAINLANELIPLRVSAFEHLI
ncbi:cobalamin B12-binding domain-containing protein [Parasphingorhabdus sp. DH2-15]|uniref:cobalamin B12-binding domain-containing protein n=1 Tax=Parasphingorhabdus sp. DH2-15 TaxID=3444112 RepID=UPI003F683592